MANEKRNVALEEKAAPHIAGMPMLFLSLLVLFGSIALMVFSIIWAERDNGGVLNITLIIISSIVSCIGAPIMFAGLKILHPNEALALTLFGKYYGTLKGPGYFYVNPFVSAFNPGSGITAAISGGQLVISTGAQGGDSSSKQTMPTIKPGKKISLKTMTLNNEKQKINDQLGNPIIIGIVVIWRVVNTAKAVFNVDNYGEFLSIQCDSALRNIVRMYPYDLNGEENDNERSLRGSSQEIAQKLQQEIQEKVEIAGLEISEARITHLAYAPEIAAAMLQRQQASAVIDARQMIVDGAVGMVEMALAKLSEKEIVKLDEERKAAMVSNLLVVLCGNKDAQPIVNSGSLY